MQGLGTSWSSHEPTGLGGLLVSHIHVLAVCGWLWVTTGPQHWQAEDIRGGRDRPDGEERAGGGKTKEGWRKKRSGLQAMACWNEA